MKAGRKPGGQKVPRSGEEILTQHPPKTQKDTPVSRKSKKQVCLVSPV